MSELTKEERDFILLVGTMSRLPLADRKQDRVRQKMRRLGYVRYGRTEADRTNRWRITEAGRRALQPST